MPAGRWPLVGRDGELRRLERAIVEGERSGVVLVGPPGVGKTRLAREAVAGAERAGLRVVRVSATRSAASLAFGALAPLLADAHAFVEPGVVGAGACRLVEAIDRWAGGRRLVVSVDDAHLLDGASAELLHRLAAARSAFVLATVPSAALAGDPIVALWKDGLAERVDVAPLDDPAAVELLAAALGGPLDSDTAHGLVARCRGDLVLLREFVAGAVVSGALAVEEGCWRLRESAPPPERLVDVVEARFGRLDRSSRRLLELVALAEPLGSGELTALSDPSLAQSLERRGLLASSAEGRRVAFRPAHPIYGEVLRARMPVICQRKAAGSLAEVVEARGARRSGDALRVASWRLIGGGGRPEILLAGATDAWSRSQLSLAERLARAASEAGAGFGARLLAAHTAALRGRREQADTELAMLSAQASDDIQRATVALARIHGPGTHGPSDRLRVIYDTERSLTDPGWRDQLAAERLGQLAAMAGPRAVLGAAVELLERLQHAPLARACITASYHLGRLGRLDEAHRVASLGQAAEASAAGSCVVRHGWWHDIMRAHALNHAGRFAEADRLVAAGYQQAVVDDAPEARAAFALMHAAAVGDRGRVRTAAERAGRAARQLQDLGKPSLRGHGLVWQALALALGGRVREAGDVLAEVEALGLGELPLHTVGMLEARAWSAAGAGDLREARRHLERAAAVADDVGDLVGETSVLHGLARLGRADAVRHSLAAAAAQVEGELAPARVAHTEALAGHDAAGLEEVSRRFEALGAGLLAAEAAADAAVSRRRAGETRAAVAAERRARTLAQRCEDPITPGLRGVRARATLTPGEHEAALLAARGLSSREAAERLEVSVRTVENRLQRVYEKLGINKRTDLADAFGDPGPAP